MNGNSRLKSKLFPTLEYIICSEKQGCTHWLQIFFISPPHGIKKKKKKTQEKKKKKSQTSLVGKHECAVCSLLTSYYMISGKLKQLPLSPL